MEIVRYVFTYIYMNLLCQFVLANECKYLNMLLMF